MIRSVLVANRGEIACRIIRTVKRMGLRAVAVYSDADQRAAHVHMADAAVRIGRAPAAQSYLDVGALIDAATWEAVDAVHPGYGFLSESAAFATALAQAGIRFIGPTPDHLSLFGQKHTARDAALAAGVPLLPGSGLVRDGDSALSAARAIGFPVMLKSTAGGGGIGLQLCRTPEELPALFEQVSRLGAANFGDGGVFVEAFVDAARHVEVQIFGDGVNVLALGERDCSLQRRNQKVFEETPAPDLPAAIRADMMEAAARLGRSVSYRSAGTVEFIYDAARERFAFLEVNTRLQVEHPVTEAVTGIDLVEWMIREAEGTLVLPDTAPPARGHAIEARVYAEDPARDFRPSAGRITAATFAPGARVDTWVLAGTEVPPHYDPLLAKIIVLGADRASAVMALQDALSESAIDGIETNLAYLSAVAGSPLLTAGASRTTALAQFDYRPRTIEVIAPGTQTTVQDDPGRLGFWHVGVPPSGPMDPLSHRLANKVVGNPPGTAALEITLSGPTLRFLGPATFALVGAAVRATLDGTPVAMGTPVTVAAGAVLSVGTATGPGLRTTLAVRGGFHAPDILGSKSTFTLGGFGGHATGALKAGDVLRLAGAPAGAPAPLPAGATPALTRSWTLGVLYGPHGAPDFFLQEDIETLLSATYTVNVNSARTGVRLEGPAPKWARPDGGEAGLHPSNIHDNAYAVGAVDFTGDMPIILGPDGPSLGGFVCPFVVATAEQWKLGQLRPGDTVRFVALTREGAERLTAARALQVAEFRGPALPKPAVCGAHELESAVRLHRPDRPIAVAYRRQGERNLLVEFGDNVLDLDLRVRAHTLQEAVAAEAPEGLIEITPGIRSLQFQFDPARLSEAALIDRIDAIERDLAPPEAIRVPSRVVHLPLAFDDSQTRLAAERYQANTRPDAPWCPWNLEFIRRINGLSTIEDVREIVFAADYVVYGLGDVYLGAPVATPLDPRHRLVTTKYNPARTWTPQNAVGIGGAYLCIYGMEGPGGYQFVGRTVQIWNTFLPREPFREDKPWLLRLFDRLKFYPVSEAELMEMREAFPYGAVPITIEDGAIDLAAEHARRSEHGEAIRAFRARREAAFAAERQAWADAGLSTRFDEVMPEPAIERNDGAPAITAPLAGVVWSIDVTAGAKVRAGDVVAVLEAMKMEVPVQATSSGRIARVVAKPGQMVNAGAPLMTLKA